jgi:hypothetical protein
MKVEAQEVLRICSECGRNGIWKLQGQDIDRGVIDV